MVSSLMIIVKDSSCCDMPNSGYLAHAPVVVLINGSGDVGHVLVGDLVESPFAQLQPDASEVVDEEEHRVGAPQ
jgi:hypothetical protein